MYNLLMKNGQVMAFGLGVLVVLIFLFQMFGGTPDANNSGLSFGISASMFFIVFCAIAAAGFAVYQNLGNVKGLIPSVIALLGTLFVLFRFANFVFGKAAEVVANDELLANGLTAGEDSFVSTGVSIGLGMFALAGLAFVVSLVMDFFKG